MAAIHQYANNPQTALSGSVTAGATSISVASATGFPPQGKFTIIVDSEIMLVTGVTGTTWTVERGREDTTAAAHNNNATVTQILTVDSFLNAHHFDVRAFGARGNGVADDTAAIQAALDAVPIGFTASGGIVYFPPGDYNITAPLHVKSRGTQLVGAAGAYATTLRPTASFAQGAAASKSAIIVKMTDGSEPFGISIENISVRMSDAPSGTQGVHWYQSRNLSRMANVWISDVPDDANGIRVEPDPAIGGTGHSDTLIWDNLYVGYRGAGAPTGTLVRIEQPQEMTLIACKFHCSPGGGPGAARALHIVNPRGITLIGCSTADATEHIRIENTTSPASSTIGYVNLFGHTFEGGVAAGSGGRAIIANGSSERIIGLFVHAPRYYNLNGASIQLVNVDNAEIDAGPQAMTLDAGCDSNVIVTRNLAAVTDSGTNNTILAHTARRAKQAGVDIYQDRFWIPAREGFAQTGTPVLGTVGAGRLEAWLMDPAGTERVGFMATLPPHWLSSEVRVKLYWTNAGAGAGNVVWQCSITDAADGASLAVSDVNLDDTFAAPAQDVLKISAFTAQPTLDASQLLFWRIVRIGGGAADTLGNDAGLIGVMLERV